MIDPEDKLTPPTFRDVMLARRRIAPHLRPTPVYQSPLLDDALGFEAFVKCESVQPTGAFKVRGGINLMSVLPEELKRRGVITASSGNHGQSIAYAGKTFGTRVIVHVPASTSSVKVRTMEVLGAEVVARGKDYDEAREMAEDRAEREGYYYIHNANEPYLIAGVGTVVLELLETVPDLEVLLIPVGGGSGACGGGLVAKTLNPDIRVIGVQAEGADAVYRSWRDGRLQQTPEVATFAEGLATRVAFELPFKMLRQLLDDFILVSDGEMWAGIRFLLENAHMVSEGAGAATTAAALKLAPELRGRRVGLILSGGNLSLDRLRTALGE
ncbi:MAG: threonine/serine dehydratase [Bacillota bacterium]